MELVMERLKPVARPSRVRIADAPLPDLFTPDQWLRLVARFGLTRRQQQVARLMCQGYQQDQIADLLCVSRNTVRMHIRAALRAAQAHSRLGLVVRLVLAERDSA